MTARIFNVLIGVWLIISAYAWPHSKLMTDFTVGCGIATAAFAIAAIFWRPARYLNLVVAAILFSTTALMEATVHATFWNNLISAVAIFIASLLGTADRESVREERELYGHT